MVGLIDNMVPTIDIECFTGDKARRIMRQKGGGNTDVVDTDETADGSFDFAFSSSSSNSGIPEAARVASGPGEIA